MVDDVLSRLEELDCRPRKSGTGWSARCPAHDDSNPSLHIEEGRTGGVVVHCHAGCTPERVCQALGITITDLKPPTNTSDTRITATYDYHTATGTVGYQVVRLDPKTFRQRRPDGNGGWIWNMHGVPRVLYHLPDVIAAIKTGAAIWIAEGEKDADALIRVGVTATCNPGGAGKWDAEYTKTLAGANVIITADRDEPGRQHAQRVAGALTGVAASVTIVEPAEGKDAADHLRSGLQLGDFRPLTITDAEPPSNNGAGPLHQLDVARLLASAPPVHEWVWDGYIERKTLTILHGDGGTGKSILAGHLARAITNGGICLGHQTTQGNVLIIDAENPLDEITRRLHALDFAHAPMTRIAYYRASDPVLGDTTHVDTGTLANVITLHQSSVVILDSQRGVWAGDEREANEIRPLYRRLQALAEHLNCSIIIIHHDRRTGNFSGSSDIHNSADTRLHLERPDADKPERVLRHAKARSSAELPPASYTFTFDPNLSLFTFTQPREPITDLTIIRDALTDEWQTGTEISNRAGIRRVEAETTLWTLVRNGDAQYAEGPQGRSAKAKCWRRLTHLSQNRDKSGQVDPEVPSATCPPGGPPP